MCEPSTGRTLGGTKVDTTAEGPPPRSPRATLPIEADGYLPDASMNLAGQRALKRAMATRELSICRRALGRCARSSS